MHRNRLYESKSVSDITIVISNEICDKLKRLSASGDDAEQFVGEYTSVMFHRVKFLCGEQYSDLFGGNITVFCDIYYCEDESDYRSVMNNGLLDCLADINDNSIRMSVAVVNGVLRDDFADDVHHEVNHLLQNAYGGKKNETLYGRCVSIIHDNTIEQPYKSPAYAVYYTFRSEQDSFAPQFYSMLCRQKDLVKNFDDAIGLFPFYRSLMNSYRMTVDNNTDEEICGVVRLMGLTMGKWENFIGNGIKRLRRKLRHAHDRYLRDMTKVESVRGTIRRQQRLYERYGTSRTERELLFVF